MFRRVCFFVSMPETGTLVSSVNTFKRRRAVAAVFVGLSLVAVAIVLYTRQPDSSEQPPGPELPAAISRADYDSAAREFERRYGRRADRFDTLSWLGDASFRNQKLKIAEACYAQIPVTHPRYGRQALYQRGQVLIHLHRAAEAETCLRAFLALERETPQSPIRHRVDATQRLRYLLETQLRFEERKQLIAGIVKSGQGDIHDVMFYSFPALLRWNGPQTVEKLEEFWKQDPDNLNLQIALARYRTGQGRLDEARELLEKCRRKAPDHPRVVAAELALGRESGTPEDWSRIGQRLETLPAPKAADPWLLLRIRGAWHNRQKEFSQAARCFQLALEGDPANPEAYLGLARAYNGLGQPKKRKRALEKSQVLARIQPRLVWTQSKTQDVQPFIEIAELCEQIELFERAILVARIARRYAPQNETARALVERLESAHPNLP